MRSDVIVVVAPQGQLSTGIVQAVEDLLVRAEDLPRYGVRAENERTASKPSG